MFLCNRLTFIATANVDFATDAKIQQTIRESFAHATVLAIAHRIRTVLDYDKIIVLERGSIVEVGAPNELMRSHGPFAQLVQQ